MSRIWEQWERDGGKGPPPPIVAIVVHNGTDPWPYEAEFSSLFSSAPVMLKPFIPSFQYVLVDLAAIPDDQLSGDPELRAGLMVMKRIQWPDLDEHVDELLIEVLIFDDVALKTVLSYVAGRLDFEQLVAAMEQVGAMQDGERMNDFIEFLEERYKARWEAKWIEKSKAEGVASGIARAKAQILVRQLTRRFGTLPDDARARIEAADIATLDRWLDRVIDAPDLNSVLSVRRKRQS